MTESLITPASGGGRVMITNGGPHPPELWAQVTAEHVMPLGPTITGTRRRAAIEVQGKVEAALEKIHTSIQEDERALIEADPSRMMADYDPDAYLDEAMAAIADAVKGTGWEQQYGDPDALAALRQAIGSHFATAQHVERAWHADRNPAAPEAVAFRALHHPGAGTATVKED